MNQLAPCSQCKRHIRVGDAACPFCGAAGKARGRSVTLASGMKRAAIFALGTSLAAACSDGDEPGDVNSPSSPTSTASGSPSATASSSSTGGTSTSTAAVTTQPLPTQVQPVYGAPVTASSSALIQPPYGAPPVTVTPTVSAPPSDFPPPSAMPPGDAGDVLDAAVPADAASDAAQGDAGVSEPVPSQFQPVYGAVPGYGAPAVSD